MSTDTALALGFLSLVGQGVSDKVRVFLLTAFVVDDIVALIVIAVVCSGDIAGSRSSWRSACSPSSSPCSG